MLRAHGALALIHFAPIRRAADEHCGSEDPQPLRYQNNEYAYRWYTHDDEGLSYAEIRADLESGWASFIQNLKQRYDGVAAIQAKLAFDYSGPTLQIASTFPALAQALAVGAVFCLNLRSAVPPQGTFELTATPGDSQAQAVLHASFVGHPRSPSVEKLMRWFDGAHIALEAKLAAAFTRPRQDTPYLWAETPRE